MIKEFIRILDFLQLLKDKNYKKLNNNYNITKKYWIIKVIFVIMKKIKINKYDLSIILFTALIFYFNLNHNIQQGTLENYFIPIAKNLINNLSYSLPKYTSTPSFYPIWGYTFLILPDILFKTNTLIILILQYIFTLISIYFFYKIFQLKKSYYHLFFFIPFISIMSTKTPDAIICFLIILIIYFLKNYFISGNIKFLVLTGIANGILLNFRSEYLYLFIITLLVAIISYQNSLKIFFKISIVVLIISFIFLLPWIMRSYYYTNEFKFTATNGGAVIYISLGQLPGNKWKIQPYDETVYKIADSLNFSNPYTLEADKYFKSEFFKAIKKYPFDYVKKIAYNFISSLIRGVYTGEFANTFIDKDLRFQWEKSLNKQIGLQNKFDFILKTDYQILIPVLLEKFIQLLFIPIFFILFVLTTIKFLKYDFDKLDLFLLSIILYKLIIVSLIQYEYRHMNSIYLILLGITFSTNFNFKFFKKVLGNKINHKI